MTGEWQRSEASLRVPGCISRWLPAWDSVDQLASLPVRSDDVLHRRRSLSREAPFIPTKPEVKANDDEG